MNELVGYLNQLSQEEKDNLRHHLDNKTPITNCPDNMIKLIETTGGG